MLFLEEVHAPTITDGKWVGMRRVANPGNLTDNKPGSAVPMPNPHSPRDVI
jgi:hypothetical protein